MEGKKYVLPSVRNHFSNVLSDCEKILFNGQTYYSINNSQIKKIEAQYNSFPEEVILLENNYKFKVNQLKMHNKENEDFMKHFEMNNENSLTESIDTISNENNNILK